MTPSTTRRQSSGKPTRAKPNQKPRNGPRNMPNEMMLHKYKHLQKQNSFHRIMNKENITPKHRQGIQYQISTGKNSGVYLSQDISQENYLSLSLLTKEAQSAHKSFIATLHHASPSQTHMNLQTEVESFHETYKFLTKNIQKIHGDLSTLGLATKEVRKELEGLREKAQIQNNQLQQGAIPAFKNLKEKIKENKKEQNAMNCKLKREVLGVQRDLEEVERAIKQCERKMSMSEYGFGGREGDQ